MCPSRDLSNENSGKLQDTYRAFRFSGTQSKFPFKTTKIPVYQDSAASDGVDKNVTDTDVSMKHVGHRPGVVVS